MSMQVNPDFYIIRISKDLQKKKRNKMTIASVGFLGIKYSYELSDKGFVVSDTHENSPARRAGFKKGDIITAINGIKVESYKTFIDVVSKNGPGQAITISYISALTANGTITTKDVVLDERPLQLDVPAGTQDMRFNLQFGDVVAIGTRAALEFPEVQLLDTLIVHHSVEYKERSEGDKNWNDWHLMEDDENYEYRYVHATKEVLGVWKIHETDAKKALIPYHDYIYCHPNFTKSSWQKRNGVWLPDEWEASLEDNATKLDDLKMQVDQLATLEVMKAKKNEQNYLQQEDILTRIAKLNDERAELTRKMHQKHLIEARIIYINPKTNQQYNTDLDRGDYVITDYYTLYPLDIFGLHYVLARPAYIEAFIKN